ncbi:hypothetical protein FUA23_04270 [Neolewinella aurantiaca]|uniref:Uncharacterized protein n=1 Tax=Neolewinella aurantiaca TaxID=2602767 RepID=A0A5C7G076_9BACT|nr:hypothetical protein [Neolewinella aurantiaca]TXF91026.1 hypothetical protein FUA23_04270 [Neolewinella aurantiaca]
MKKFSGLLPLLLVFIHCTCVSAQNIGIDLARIVHHTELAREVGTSANNPSLDTIVMTLAYYGGMPSHDKIRSLLSGPELLGHYAGNPAIRSYLIEEKIDLLLESYVPSPGMSVPETLATPGREKFLKKLNGAELFSRNGVIDLGKIHDTYAAPPATGLSLKAAAKGANSQQLGLSTSNLMGSALAGLSDWISRRAQEELTYTFLTKLREDINRNDLNYLFPKTSEFLPTLDLLNYKAILPSIRKAFVEDLNAVAFNLGNYLDQRKAGSFRDPVVYNIFLIYRILDLEMRDVSLAEILAFTYGELEKTRVDTRTQIDLRMTKADTTDPSYQAILNAFDNLIVATDTLNNRFDLARDKLSNRQFNPLLTEIQKAELSDDEAMPIMRRIRDIYFPVNDATLPLKNNYWEIGANPPATGIVRAWLRGKEPYAYYEAYPSVSRYDELFGPDAKKLRPDELRAAGLTAVREVLAHRGDLDKYEDLLDDLLRAREDLVEIQLDLQQQRDAQKRLAQSFEERKRELQEDIDAELSNSNAPALRMLRRLTEEIPSDTKANAERLAAIKNRLEEWVMKNGSSTSPYIAKMKQTPRQAAYFPPLQPAIDATRIALEDLHSAVEFHTASNADSLIRAYHNLSTFETVFGMAQQVFFLLSAGEQGTGFVRNRQLSDFQTNPAARKLFSGMGYERLSRVPELDGKFSSEGITGFLLDFGLFLSDFQSRNHEPDLDKLSPKAIRKIQAVSFITTTLQSLLEAPILNPRMEAGKPTSLAGKYPAFADVPEVSRQLNEMFRLSQTGEYRYAVDNLLNLLKLFNVAPTASHKERKLTERRDELLHLIESYVVDEDENLKAVGLAVPTADALPMLGNNRDKALLSRYEMELNTPGLDAYALEDANNGIRDLKIRRIQEELSRVQNKIKKLNPERTDRFREKLFRYGTFMADVAKADDPADFEAAVSSIALPTGSSQIKRNKPSSVELGAYFGAALSREGLVLPPGISAPELEEEVFGASLFVPVGVSYSRNIGGSKSITLFGSLLDLGALTAFRLESRRENGDGATVDRLPEFRPANVIAPGLHIMYNFPQSPFTLGFGVQDGPSVRKFTLDGENRERDARSTRAMLTLSVDVPIFRFFNK